MTKSEAFRELESMGTEQNRKLYQRHGVKGPAFGVSYANLGALQRRIRVDHPLALALWATGNHDARVLANMIADPNSMSARELDRWIAEVDNHMLSESMASMLLRSNDAHAHAQRWIDSPQEWICATGWQVFGGLASGDHEFSSEYLLKRLMQIQNTIQRAPNRVRHSMVLALIGIGTRGDKLEEAAVTAACMIGPVHVDHGETNCVTPEPISYLRRIAAHRSAKSLAAAAAAPPKKKAKEPRRARPSKANGSAGAGAQDSNAFTDNKTTPRHDSDSSSDARFAKKANSGTREDSTRRARADGRRSSKAARPNSTKSASGGSSKSAKPKGAAPTSPAKAARPGSAKSEKSKSAAPTKSTKAARAGSTKSTKDVRAASSKSRNSKAARMPSKPKAAGARANKAAKKSSSAQSKTAKKPASGVGSPARSVPAGARARKKTPAGPTGARAAARSSKSRPGSRASR